MDDQVPRHSGSRWEPQPAARSGSVPAATDAIDSTDTADTGRRRRPRPVLALLVSALVVGTTAGGVALARAEQPSAPDQRSGGSTAPLRPEQNDDSSGDDIRQRGGDRRGGHHSPDAGDGDGPAAPPSGQTGDLSSGTNA